MWFWFSTPTAVMTSRKDTQRKRKAFAKRRSQRLASDDVAQSPETGEASQLRVDGAQAAPLNARVSQQASVGTAIAETIVEFAASRSDVRDPVILSALRSCYHGTNAKSDDSRQLASQLSEIPDRLGVRYYAFRKELQDLLSVARGQQETGIPNPFLQLLRMLAK